MKRILIIANKTWELHPLLDALLNPRFQANPKKPFFPHKLFSPWTFSYGDNPLPRAIYTFHNINVEVWCIADHMNPKKSASSSEEKAQILPSFLRYEPTEPDLVIAFGTGSAAPEEQSNGSVFVGSNIFIHDAHPASAPNPKSAWRSTQFDRLIKSSISEDVFELMRSFQGQVEKKMLSVRTNPTEPKFQIAQNFVGVSTVNVTDFHQYAEKDPHSVEAFKLAGVTDPIGSVETTHGVIRLQSDAPFMFVSGIPNRFGKFELDMGPNSISQNYAAGFNAGIVITELLPKLDRLYQRASSD